MVRELPQHQNSRFAVGSTRCCEYFGADSLPGDARTREVVNCSAQAFKGRTRGCSLWRVEIDTDSSEGIDHGSGSEKVLYREPPIVGTCRNNRDERAITQSSLQVEHPCGGLCCVADRAHQDRTIEGGHADLGAYRVAPHENVSAIADRCGAFVRPIKAHLKLFLGHVPTLMEARERHWLMRILLKLELDCSPEAAWRAIRSPAVMNKVASPLVTFVSLEQQGFPSEWPEGEHRVIVSAFGLVEIGTQAIGVSYPRRSDGVRVMRDSGPALSGQLAIVSRWRHQIAIAPSEGGRTLYRDELSYSAGLATPLLWPMYWLFWQWRAFGLRRLAPSFR